MSSHARASLLLVAAVCLPMMQSSCERESGSYCPADFTECDGECVNLLTDNRFCSATSECGTGCAAGEVCNGAGVCTLFCWSGLTECGGECVNLLTDNRFCSADGTCGAPCAEGHVCDGTGVCALSCQSGLTECGGECVNLLTDNRFCSADGTCGTACPEGYVCDGTGVCALSCQNGLCPLPFVWVVNSALNAVQVVNAEAGGGVIATVSVGTNPQRLVFAPDGGQAYVSNQTDNTVSVIDIATRSVTATIPVGDGPTALDVNPDGTCVYVACGGSNVVSVIDSSLMSVFDTIDTGPQAGPFSVSVRPDGTELWTTTDGYLKVFSLPTHTGLFTSSWTDGFISGWTKFLPDSSVFWATSACGCCGNVQRYTASTYGQVSDHRFGSVTSGLAMSPDGSAVYLGYWGDAWGCSGPETLVKLNGTNDTVELTTLLSKPWDGVVSSDGGTLYLVRKEEGLSVVDTATLTVLRTFTIGGMAEDVALSP